MPMERVSKNKRVEEETTDDSSVKETQRTKGQGHQEGIRSTKTLSTKPCLNLDKGQRGGTQSEGKVKRIK